MSQFDHKIFFDISKIKHLYGVRSQQFDSLIDSVVNSPDDSLERVAFVKLIASLSICETCDINQFRAASRGCALCAEDSLKRAEISDQKLIAQFKQNINTIQKYLEVLNE